MPVPVTCPKCHQVFAGPDNAAGQETYCPHCGTAVIMPAIPPSAAQGPPPPPGNQQPGPPPPGFQQVGPPPPGYQQPGPPPPPGYQGPAGGLPMGPKPSNHLVWAILATIFCCVPFGIVAIVYSSQVDGKFIRGDYHGALESANKAKTWCWVSFAIGLVGTVIVITKIAAAGSCGGY